nr:hypothetical protein [Tanacetum cinerariifolium]
AYTYYCQMKVNAAMHKLTTAGDGYCCWESDGFEQIVNFLNANPIKFALIVSPTIYTSCIKQFWTSIKVKTVNEDVRLQALVDGKKVIINEASIRRDLRLGDTEGLFLWSKPRPIKQLKLKSYKRVKKLEGKNKKRTHRLKRLYKGRMNKEDLFGVHDLSGDKVFMDVTTSENIEQDATVAEKSFEEVQQAFNKTMDWVNNFVAMDSEAVKDRVVECSKRAGEELKQEITKKQKLDEQVQAMVADDNTTKLKRCFEIVPEDDDDVTIEATPLSSKSPTIVDYKIYREGKKSYFNHQGR